MRLRCNCLHAKQQSRKRRPSRLSLRGAVDPEAHQLAAIENRRARHAQPDQILDWLRFLPCVFGAFSCVRKTRMAACVVLDSPWPTLGVKTECMADSYVTLKMEPDVSDSPDFYASRRLPTVKLEPTSGSLKPEPSDPPRSGMCPWLVSLVLTPLFRQLCGPRHGRQLGQRPRTFNMGGC